MLHALRLVPFALRFMASGRHIMLALVGLTYLAFTSANSFAETKRFQWEARITASEQYDDNIDLDTDDEESDWITAVGPGLTLTALFEETEIALSYDITFSYYLQNDENNDARHRLMLSGLKGVPIAEHWTLDLDESFLVSEDPLEKSEQTTSVQRSRDRVYRNTADARFNYLFGEEDSLSFGLLHRLYITDDPDEEDSQEFRPGADFTYWFSLRHGLSLGYEYARATFTEESDDFDKHVGSINYTYRLSPSKQANMYYGYDSTEFDGDEEDTEFDGVVDEEDYVIHHGGLGYSQQVTNNTSWSISGGYFYRDRDRSDYNDGLEGFASVITAFERGSLTLEGSGGYREQYLESENLGFTEYYRASVLFDYQLLEKLTMSISGLYTRDEYKDTTPQRDDDTWQAGVSLDYELLPWLSSSLSYLHRQRDSTEREEEYAVNRITLTFVMFYLSEPKPF